MIPTPWIGREPRYVAAARGQLTAPPDRKILAYDPLPPVDPNKVAARAEARKQAQKELNRKSATRIESAFGHSRSPFGAKTDGDAVLAQWHQGDLVADLWHQQLRPLLNLLLQQSSLLRVALGPRRAKCGGGTAT